MRSRGDRSRTQRLDVGRPDLAALVSLLRLASKDRVMLLLKDIALRQQLAVCWRSVGRLNISDCDRIV